MAAVIRHFESEPTRRPQLKLIQGGNQAGHQGGNQTDDHAARQASKRAHPARRASAPTACVAQAPTARRSASEDSVSGFRSSTLTMVVIVGLMLFVGLGVLARTQPVQADASVSGPVSSAEPDSTNTSGPLAVEVVSGGESVRAEAARTGTYVVESGDTMWSVAAAIAGPGDDVRSVVQELNELNGGSALDVGQDLVIPAAYVSVDARR